MTYAEHPAAVGRSSILAPGRMVRFRGRRLDDADRVRTRKGLFQPLLQRPIEPAGFRAFCTFLVAERGPVMEPSWLATAPVPQGDFAVGPSMLDETSKRQIQQGSERP